MSPPFPFRAPSAELTARRAARAVRSKALRLIEERTDAIVVRRLPHGVSPYYDLKRRKPEMDVVIDVGANVGQTAALLTSTWPTAAVYCVEPFKATFERLVRNTAHQAQVTCVQCAFSAAAGEEEVVVLKPGSVNNSLVNRAGPGDGAAVRETISCTTVDEFCRSHRIDHVDLLKIDTEGYDLQVLHGARDALGEQRISFVQVEAGMTRHNTKHVPFAELHRFFEATGYALFGIYDQTPEWDGRALLRFANPIFISEQELHRPASDLSLSAVRSALRRARSGW